MTSLNLRNFIYRTTRWETWPYLIKYIPIAPVWFWYSLKSRSLWFFTAANPTLTFGGFEGESKSEMYHQLPPGSYPKSILISHTLSFAEVENLMVAGSYRFPIALKPDVGMMGLMFRKIGTIEQFQKYHEAMFSDYILQEFIEYPLEVSVFYYRYPNQSSGHITGFLKKEFLHVNGNGVSTLLELMLAYPAVRLRLEEMKLKHAHKLDSIVPKGEMYCLSYALNLSRGGKLISLAYEKDNRLLQVFDNLSNYTKHFYYGRYDIKCSSVEALKQGRDFSILEYNGSGAEPHHIYGNGNTLFKAYRIIIHHWKILFSISKFNRDNGFHYWPFLKGWQFLKNAKKHFRRLKELDAGFEI